MSKGWDSYWWDRETGGAYKTYRGRLYIARLSTYLVTWVEITDDNEILDILARRADGRYCMHAD